MFSRSAMTIVGSSETGSIRNGSALIFKLPDVVSDGSAISDAAVLGVSET